MGIDVTAFDPNENGVFKYIGKKVEWFGNIRPHIFDKNEYMNCVESLSHWKPDWSN